MRWAVVLVGLGAILGCKSAPGAVSNAIIGTAMGLTAAGVSRALGDCYAGCPTGTVCNNDTGLCEALPCGGRCRVNESCDTSGITDRCVPAGIPDLIITDEEPAVPEQAKPQPKERKKASETPPE